MKITHEITGNPRLGGHVGPALKEYSRAWKWRRMAVAVACAVAGVVWAAMSVAH